MININSPIYSEYISLGSYNMYEFKRSSEILLIQVKWDSKWAIDLKLILSDGVIDLYSTYSTGDLQESIRYDFSSSPTLLSDTYYIRVENMGSSDGYFDLSITNSWYLNPEQIIIIIVLMIVGIIGISIGIFFIYIRNHKKSIPQTVKSRIKINDNEKRESFCHFCGEKVLHNGDKCSYCGTDMKNI